MLNLEAAEAPRSSPPVRAECPECHGERVIGGRAGSEYWTQRCTRCGGIHLDIVQPAAVS